MEVFLSSDGVGCGFHANRLLRTHRRRVELRLADLVGSVMNPLRASSV